MSALRDDNVATQSSSSLENSVLASRGARLASLVEYLELAFARRVLASILAPFAPCASFARPPTPSLPPSPSPPLPPLFRRNRYFPIFYIAFTFFIFPLVLLGISVLFDTGINDPNPGLLTLGIVILILIVAAGLYFWWACTRGNLKQRYYDWGTKRARRKLAIQNLADDMELLKYKVGVLAGDIQPEDEIEFKKVDAPEPEPDV